jgi:hypothetical protein
MRALVIDQQMVKHGKLKPPDLTAPTAERRVDRAAITAKLERLRETYADGVLSKEKYQQHGKALIDQSKEQPPFSIHRPLWEKRT